MDTRTPVAVAATGKRFKKSTYSNACIRTRIGRGVPDRIGSNEKSICTCQRPKTLVFCRACGYYCHGRLSIPCGVHPRVSFLFDISKCGRCNSSVYLDEYREGK